ncbi:MAG: hypothetical protein CMK59_11265 [Proteobacteria bacterium]|nr:hypothetical protein [Pseudomonadota bacterium]
MSGTAYICSTGSFLPGEPIDNDHIEAHLGYVDGTPSRLKPRILRSNGITARHYAIDSNQQTYILNEEMAAKAGRICLDRSGLDLADVGMLSVASSQGDFILPGFGSMVQGMLGIPRVELLTAHGICSSSMMALKAARNSVCLGEHQHALVVASEFASRLLKKSRYEAAVGGDRRLDFNAEFLRWMLSDGAGALLLSDRPSPKGMSLKIEWIKSVSHADTYPVCMSVGWSGKPFEELQYKTWQDYPTYADAEKDGAILIRQDVRMLENIVKLGVLGFLDLVGRDLHIEQLDHFLCHYSSHYFKGKIVEMLQTAGAMIPEEKWYTNLYTRGNTGCAAMPVMIDEFVQSTELKVGQKVFCFVPESGRFNTVYMLLSVVDSDG